MIITAIIPARLASSRFPGKPLVDICGKTMIEHVWRRVYLNDKISSVFIATCDEKIKTVAEGFGARVIMTSDKHVGCMDRIAEASLQLQEGGMHFDIVLNIQGDEPLLNPITLDLLLKPFCEGEAVSCVNLIENLDTEAEINDHSNIKVVLDQRGFVLYFSRLPIPDGIKNTHYKQLGVYGLTKEAILRYPTLATGPLEIAEKDDILRFLEHGIHVKGVLSPYKTIGVDTENDYAKVCNLMGNDEIFQKYKNM